MITVRACESEADYEVAGALMTELGFWDSAETSKLGFSAQDVLDFYYAAESALPGTFTPRSGLTLLGQVGNDVCGSVAYRRLEPQVCELKRLYVRPGLRRSGVGRALVSCLIARALAADYKLMRLETVSFMGAAIRMYEAFLFEHRAPYYDIPDIFLPITIFMEKNLEDLDVAGIVTAWQDG